jgi:hypothetical protein
MHRTGVANPAELRMLRRVMGKLSNEMRIEKPSPQYDELASYLLILFEASRDENRLLALMRRSASVLRNRPGKRQSTTLHQSS